MINKIKLNSTGESYEIEHMRENSTKSADELVAELAALEQTKQQLSSQISLLTSQINEFIGGNYEDYVPTNVEEIIADDITIRIGEPAAINYRVLPKYVKCSDVALSSDNGDIIITNDGSIAAITNVGEYYVTLTACDEGHATKTIKITVIDNE